jgi:hypothetical protein
MASLVSSPQEVPSAIRVSTDLCAFENCMAAGDDILTSRQCMQDFGGVLNGQVRGYRHRT